MAKQRPRLTIGSQPPADDAPLEGEVGGDLPEVTEENAGEEREHPGTGEPPVQEGPTLSEGEIGTLESLGTNEDAEDGFFSCVPEQGPVNRFGGRAMIGAVRSAEEGGITYSPDAVVRIPGDDMRRYSREYRKAVEAGSLRVRKREEWRAQARAETKAIAEARQRKAEKAAEKAAAEKTEAPNGG